MYLRIQVERLKKIRRVKGQKIISIEIYKRVKNVRPLQVKELTVFHNFGGMGLSGRHRFGSVAKRCLNNDGME